MPPFTGDPPASVSMRGYVSQLAAAEELWPETYVIVKTEPEHWIATLALGELQQVLDGRTDVPMRGIPYRWEGDNLVLELGPVHVRGDQRGWSSLALRIRNQAQSAEGLYEAPRARPWHGDSELISVDNVEVVNGPRPVEVRPAAPDEQLAMAAGLPVDEFGELFGFGWLPVLAGGREGVFLPELFLWGDPVQLAAGIDVDGVVIGRPVGTWQHPSTLQYDLVDPVPVNASTPRPMIESHVKSLLRRRRRAFSWCRYCGRLVAPEQRLERDVCFGCGTSVLGVVY